MKENGYIYIYSNKKGVTKFTFEGNKPYVSTITMLTSNLFFFGVL